MKKTWGIVKYPPLEMLRIWLENEPGDLQRPFLTKLFCESMNSGVYNLLKQLIGRLVFACSFGQLYFRPSKSECDQPHLTGSTSRTWSGSRQKPLHLPVKGLPPPTGVWPRHPELLFKVCLPPALLLHVLSSLSISSSIIFHRKNKKILYSSPVQLSKCIDCFLTHWGSEMFSKAFSV